MMNQIKGWRSHRAMAHVPVTMAALIGGTLLAVSLAWLGPVLNPPALARWDFQMHEGDEFRAALGLLGIRHLPVFLFSIAAGQVMFRLLKTTSLQTLITCTAPWVAYVIFTGVSESLAVGDKPFQWLLYEPAYFIWPHFAALPAGLFTARQMVKRGPRTAPR